MLAAIAIAVVAGGLTAGVGTATAAGSADLWYFLPLVSGSVDLPGCPGDFYRYAAPKQAGDVTAQKTVISPAVPGSSFESLDWFEVAGNETKNVQRVTDYPPSAAYKLRSVRIQWRELDTGELRTETQPPTSIDRQTGAVTVTGNWPARDDAFRLGNPGFLFEYDVPWTVEIGSVQESGVGFTATGLAPQDWPVMDGAGLEIVEGPAICRYRSGNQ
ncbi:hypothetical protein [Rhodococcus tukisamuensis]|uniref:Uncharacterized protein n=1 Tax=Rhodococcus tukisamuensis TaxID=168276 RepID=A0A1G6M1I8_9NOCA|nr:hypothetical protein [Rhodococcus tukisamuensis]SDC49408.1 hypothetical protein SAMN05444580_10135 [Rhodococcus tukisamuensis]